MDAAEITRRFAYHPPTTPAVGQLHESIRGEVMGLAYTLDALLEDGREKSLVMTALEEAMFWANASIARNQTAVEERLDDDIKDHPASQSAGGSEQPEEPTP